jgi:hypothetical protein
MSSEATLRDLIKIGLIRTPAKLVAVYKGLQFDAVVREDGVILYRNEIISSLSVAAGRAMVDAGMPPAAGLPYRHANGWTFWKLFDEGLYTPMADLRKKASAGNLSP